jgi:hypothetical protein
MGYYFYARQNHTDLPLNLRIGDLHGKFPIPFMCLQTQDYFQNISVVIILQHFKVANIKIER